MALLIPARYAQYPVSAEFTWNFGDTAKDTVSGTTKSFGSTFADALVLDAIPVPANMIISGGELIVETAYVGPTVSTVAVGDSLSATRYLAATSLLAAARTALTITGFRGNGENIRLTFNHTVANASAGKATLRIFYTVSGKANENVIV